MKGNERKWSKKWVEAFKTSHPCSWIYKVPDSPVCRKPFDCIAILKEGDCVTPLAIEFKMESNDLTDHQRYELMEAKRAGARALVVYFKENGEVAREVTL